jgi:hypothetical protein
MHYHDPDIWSLWNVSGRGLFLVHEDRRDILIQEVRVDADMEAELPTLVATSKSPNGRRTVLRGEGGHPEIFETALTSHLDLLEIGRDRADRVDIEDLIPVGSVSRMTGIAAP